MARKGLFILGLVSTTLLSFGQKYPQNYFQSPLDIPLYVSGTFGELRSNHFHAGLDLKTQGQEGKRVLAAADGYVSRINVSTSGYGKAIYITHPNGYMSVYAHLQRFNEEIEEYVRQHQYQKRSFELTLYPNAGELPVSQGNTIALSGNTGGSGGPHLHFEIRDQGGERALNPLLFGLPVSDSRSPKLFRVKLYEIDQRGFIRDEKTVDIAPGPNGVYLPVGRSPISIHNTFAVGVQGYDHQDGSQNKNGIYRVVVKKDDEAFFSFQADGIRFDQSRYINGFIDYAAKKNKGQTFYRLFKPNNYNLDAHPEKTDRGVLHITDTNSFDLQIEALDFHGNKTLVKIPLIIDCKDFSESYPYGSVWQYDMLNSVSDQGMRAILAPFSLYQDARIEYSVYPACTQCLAPIFSVGSFDIPIHRNVSIFFSREIIDSSVPREKMIMVRREKPGSSWSSIGADDNTNIHLMSNSKTFGEFSIMADTIAPKVYPINFSDGFVLKNNSPIKIHISDDFSGIGKYEAFVNDQWILMEYEPKGNVMFYTFDNRLPSGTSTLKVRVWDNCNNKTERSWKIVVQP
ncbi:MAG: M23 family metallopeptidase [Flavobacteriales bacterium]|nr:MAG: M23 family metallopeptidase [Flavobacteriales bacterium]